MADDQTSGYSSTVTPIEIPRQVSNELQQPTASSPDWYVTMNHTPHMNIFPLGCSDAAAFHFVFLANLVLLTVIS
jgi:hypothetical protein